MPITPTLFIKTRVDIKLIVTPRACMCVIRLYADFKIARSSSTIYAK